MSRDVGPCSRRPSRNPWYQTCRQWSCRWNPKARVVDLHDPRFINFHTEDDIVANAEFGRIDGRVRAPYRGSCVRWTRSRWSNKRGRSLPQPTRCLAHRQWACKSETNAPLRYPRTLLEKDQHIEMSAHKMSAPTQATPSSLTPEGNISFGLRNGTPEVLNTSGRGNENVENRSSRKALVTITCARVVQAGDATCGSAVFASWPMSILTDTSRAPEVSRNASWFPNVVFYRA